MGIIWKCVTTANSRFNEQMEYLSEPSIDLIERFKKDIVNYEKPEEHRAYQYCDRLGKNKGLMLFVLDGRVEVIIKQDKENQELIFTNCADN